MKRLMSTASLLSAMGVIFAIHVAADDTPRSRVQYTLALDHQIQKRVDLPGTVEAPKSSLVASEVEGAVRKLHAREGQFVKRGAPLVSLKAEHLEFELQAARASHREAEARFARAERNLDRSQDLFEGDVLSRQQLDDSRYELDAWRAKIDQLGAEIRRIELDIDAGETRTREFLGKNPNGKIPALELASGDVLCESNAILFFIAAGTALLPQDNLERARVLQWMFFEQYSHEPYIAVSRYALKHLEPSEDRRALVESKREPGYKALGVMESHLAGRSFFVDQVFTIADIALYAYTHVAHEGEFDLADFAATRAWLARISSQPGHIPITQA